ncbi:FHA domain-containing protein FHA2-like [Salvia splendens]|uniref:FHA domain-containing protein FHA2-like n=1 Tax=Salvia splendens TaxID=180675 RepID=UPI001C2807FA|nr:FHA domain-containing protein FHA2-like [Salvia splendens]
MESGGDVEAGFAKLQGEDFEYFMQTYSIILGRNSKNSAVDVDLSSLGGGMNISRRHARIFYDFQRRRFALEVLGRNGCYVEGVLHVPGHPPIKLDSQDRLEIGDKEFYFLLPGRSILGGPIGPRNHGNIYQTGYVQQQNLGNQPPPPLPSGGGGWGEYDGEGSEQGEEEEEEEEDEEEDCGEDASSSGKRMRGDGGGGYRYGSDKQADVRTRVDREADNQQLLQLEENDVVSSVASLLSDLCGPGDWMPMEKLHSELVEQFSDVWHHSRVRKYLTPEDHSGQESQGKPWFGLLVLLKKYPEHFVVNTRSKGRVVLEFVSLIS